jgi:hypothetical protein
MLLVCGLVTKLEEHMAVYDEPGKGRKQCPKCSFYTGKRSATCENCFHSFREAKADPTPVVLVKKGPEVAVATAPVSNPNDVVVKKGPRVASTGVVVKKGPEVAVATAPVVKIPKVYDEPGNGRKQCPKCNKYAPIVYLTCANCQNDFTTSAAVKKVVEAKTYDGPGKKRKQCKCGVYLGYTTQICPKCSHEFKAAQPKVAPPVAVTPPVAVPVKVKQSTPSGAGILYLPLVDFPPSAKDLPIQKVFIPAGECPAKLKSTDIEAVEKWAMEVQKCFAERRMVLSVQGLMYFAQTLYDFDSPDCGTVQEHIRTLFAA